MPTLQLIDYLSHVPIHHPVFFQREPYGISDEAFLPLECVVFNESAYIVKAVCGNQVYLQTVEKSQRQALFPTAVAMYVGSNIMGQTFPINFTFVDSHKQDEWYFDVKDTTYYRISI